MKWRKSRRPPEELYVEKLNKEAKWRAEHPPTTPEILYLPNTMNLNKITADKIKEGFVTAEYNRPYHIITLPDTTRKK